MLNMFSGGALSRASILALGIMPYISASIVMQLLATVSPALAELKKEGAAGQRKITKYTRYATVVLLLSSNRYFYRFTEYVATASAKYRFYFYFTAVVSLVTGTMFLMWLGEQITERGIGNGISILVLVVLLQDCHMQSSKQLSKLVKDKCIL